MNEKINFQSFHLSSHLQSKLTEALDNWTKYKKMKMLWSGDANLWTNNKESNWLGWLRLPYEQLQELFEIEKFSEEIKNENVTDILLLGMGGSSLCPEVMSQVFGPIDGRPTLHILDSTDPGQIIEVQKLLSIKTTLFIVSSKSGSTLEPNIFFEYFYDQVKKETSIKEPGRQFVAITDAGSHLEVLAKEKSFRRIFYGKNDVGGRYSALSNFGIVPASLMGVRVEDFLKQSLLMVEACDMNVPPKENPAAMLGIILAEAALIGKNKITFICSERIRNFDIWLEQLLAESTGKEGKGFIPITGETLTMPEYYSRDRFFVYLKVLGDDDPEIEEKLAILRQNGHPFVEILITNIYDLGQEFFRWEMATAVAGSILGINPFDQPDVEASKIATKELTNQFEKHGSLKDEEPLYEEENIQVFKNEASPQKFSNLAEALKAGFGEIKNEDYFGILAYLPMESSFQDEMQKIRLNVRDKKRVATCLEFGPRFLHSTGQAYKGGPTNGIFLELTADPVQDLAIPERRVSFGIVEMAQAKGDFQVLTQKKNQRGLRIHFKKDVASNLKILTRAIDEALSSNV